MHLMAVNRLAKSSPDWVPSPAEPGLQGFRSASFASLGINLEAFIGRLL